MDSIIDLRSDTVTKPTEGMRDAIARAEVGDDVYGEDPMVNKLQKRIAEMTGKEAALFVPSGTQANQIALKSQTQPGDEVICEYMSHIFNFEAGSPALLSGIQLHPLHGDGPVLDTEQVKKVIRPPDHHFPKTRLIAVENTHNRHGGRIYPLDRIKELRKLADEHGLLIHMDGARLWNASVATGIPLREFAEQADTVSLCFSKGLGAPVGSILAGSAETMDRAHYYRKVFGGGMRQAGLLAAAALYAMDHHLRRLFDDHRHAKQLAERFATYRIFTVNPELVDTNIIIITLQNTDRPAAEISSMLREEGVLINAIAPDRLRAVLHIGISDADLDRVANTLDRLFS